MSAPDKYAESDNITDCDILMSCMIIAEVCGSRHDNPAENALFSAETLKKVCISADYRNFFIIFAAELSKNQLSS